MKRIKIGPHWVTVVYQPMEENGVSRLDQLTILINSELPEATQQETLWHEIMHFAHWIVGRPLDLKAEEKFINPVSTILWGVLKDNPDIIEYLQEQF